MLIEGAALAFLAADFVYHRWFEDKPIRRRPEQEIQIPRTADGTPVPLIYGRVRARSPILVAQADPKVASGYFQMNMFFVLGIPFDDGKGINRVHGMWAGDAKLDWSDPPPTQTGDGGPEGPVTVIGTSKDGSTLLGEGLLEFLNGKPTQSLADNGQTSADARTNVGRNMLRARNTAGGFGLTVATIPGYRGYMSVHLFGGGQPQWITGTGPNIPSYSFECSSYRDSGGYPAVGTYAAVGMDSNPINVLYDLYVAKFSKLGLDSSWIDRPSFQDAAVILSQETHGYSRYIEDASQADDHIQEILRQIDAVVYADETVGTLKIKLIRNDYNPLAIPIINKDNCKTLQNFAAGGWTNIINKVKVVWTNRDKDYTEDSTTERNPANAVGQSQVNELVLQFPGVCYPSLAGRIAVRELAARSRPLIKCRAIVDRSFLRVNPGDPVKLVWTSPDIAGLVFRVAGVERGTVEDGMIALDLIQDFYYVFRDQIPKPPFRGTPDITGWGF